MRSGSAGPRPEGMVMTVTFELDGRRLAAMLQMGKLDVAELERAAAGG